MFDVPTIPLARWTDAVISFLVEHCAGITRTFAGGMEIMLNGLESGLLLLPPWLFIILTCLLVWRLTRRISLTLFVAVGFGLLWNLTLWKPTMNTLSLVLAATMLAVSVGVPLGILVVMYPLLRKVIMPVLDVMQTMPAFVYLIPAIPFFGMGKVAAMVATVVFSIPPAIRLTYLGIRQVPVPLVECAEAFGSTRMQRLVKLELPLAAPSIVAGINQTVMLALSMVVIAAMIGAGGLGGEVWTAIQRLQTGKGFVAGLGIVIVAITLDRLFQAAGNKIGGRGASKQL
jgi:glycine betaine/proline transport system permease protein